VSNKLYFIIGTIGAFSLDICSKILVNCYLKAPIIIIPGALRLELAHNAGVSFSLLNGNFLVPILTSIVMLIVVGFFLYKFQNKFSKIQFIFIGIFTGSVLGNLIDRIISSNKSVTDFIGYFNWFIGNVADIGILISIIFLIISLELFPKVKSQD
jgi:signal peptidase II